VLPPPGGGVGQSLPPERIDMTMTRSSGLFFALLGLALYAIIIPHETESVDYGGLRPETIPNLAALVLLAAGAKLALAPEGSAGLIGSQALRAAAFLGLAGLAAFLMGRFGFAHVAPAYAAVQMLLIGERRPLWLLAGVVIFPSLIWFAVTVVLDRPLP
jgi:putative tricarboxylic transport membrane protein